MMMIKIFIFLVSCTIAEPGCRVNLVPFLNWCLVDIKVFLVTWLTDWGCFWGPLQSCNTCFPCIPCFTLPWPTAFNCIVPSESTSTCCGCHSYRKEESAAGGAFTIPHTFDTQVTGMLVPSDFWTAGSRVMRQLSCLCISLLHASRHIMGTTKRVPRSRKPHKTVQDLHKYPMDFNSVMVGKGVIVQQNPVYTNSLAGLEHS